MSMPEGAGLTVDPSQFDLHNETQAAEFLEQMLDDSILKYDAQKYSRYFWYGVLVFIGMVAAYNAVWKGTMILR